MKNKICILTLFAMFSFSSAFAQFDDEKLQEDLEKMEEQFQSIFKDLGLDADSGIFVDTFFFKNLEDFQPGYGLEFFLEEGLKEFPLEEMMGMMEQGMGQMESLDFSEFEKLFDAFGLEPDAVVPAPDRLPEDGTLPAKRKKKRKSYSL